MRHAPKHDNGDAFPVNTYSSGLGRPEKYLRRKTVTNKASCTCHGGVSGDAVMLTRHTIWPYRSCPRCRNHTGRTRGNALAARWAGHACIPAPKKRGLGGRERKIFCRKGIKQGWASAPLFRTLYTSTCCHSRWDNVAVNILPTATPTYYTCVRARAGSSVVRADVKAPVTLI